jgi:hypothetical protein
MQAPIDFETEPFDTFLESEATDPVSSITSSWIQQAAIRSALRSGNEALAVRFAILTGVRDQNKLADLIFFTRHPERGNRRLTRDDPQFVQLAREWQTILSGIVRPALATATGQTTGAAPSLAAMKNKPAWVARLAPLLNRHRGDIPLFLLLGWIQRESGGRIDETTYLDERGYFQLHPGESKTLKLDHKRLSTDSDYSIQGGIKLVQYYMRLAEKLGFARNTEVFWHMVKFLHALGSGAVPLMLRDMRAHGVEPQSWEAIRSYAAANRDHLRQLFLKTYNKPFDPVKHTANVDKTFAQGRQLAEGLSPD